MISRREAEVDPHRVCAGGFYEGVNINTNQCVRYGSDEGKALSEGIAGMVAMAMSQILFPDKAWMSYDVNSSYFLGATVARGSHNNLMAVGPGYSPPWGALPAHFYPAGHHSHGEGTCDKAGRHEYNAALLQAYWQILKRRNCAEIGFHHIDFFGSGLVAQCLSFEADLEAYTAILALFYAIAGTSGSQGNYFAFAAEMLEFFLIGGHAWAALHANLIFEMHGILGLAAAERWRNAM